MTDNGHPIDLSEFSPSRLRTISTCGLSFDYKYRRQIPAPYDKANMVFGNVIHYGVERWYGTEADGDNFKSTSLVDKVEEVWWDLLPPDVATHLRKVIQAERDLQSMEQLIQITRPQIKSPRTTKGFMESGAFKRFEDARDGMLEVCTNHPVMRWGKDENAFQAYTKSLHIAQRLQNRWQHRPRPLAVERSFNIEFAGVRLRGRMDLLRCDPDPQGQVLIDLTDIKTGKQLMTQMEAFLQAFSYYEACAQMEDLPTPDIVTFWLARHDRPQHGRIDRERHTELATRILNGLRRDIEQEQFEPRYGMWCKSCDFRDLCEQEIGFWTPNTDGLSLEVSVA